MWTWIKSLFSKSKDVKEITLIPKGAISIGFDPAMPGADKTVETLVKSNPLNPDWDYIACHIEIDKERAKELIRICDQIRAAAEMYLIPVQEATGVPWELIGALHYREASLNFALGLHCGERWNKATTLVPKGRGPFKSWKDAAIDALKLKGYHTKKSWSFGECMARAEAFNGLGYRRKGIYSPYVTAGTNFSEERGRYVADHKFDPNSPESRVGVAAIMIMLGYKYKLD